MADGCFCLPLFPGMNPGKAGISPLSHGGLVQRCESRSLRSTCSAWGTIPVTICRLLEPAVASDVREDRR